mgnify:FL=1
MNKKVLVLIIVLVVLVLIGGGIYLFTRDSEENNEKSPVNNNNNNVNNENNNNDNETDELSTLVVYFSNSGNTEILANFIHNYVGGDIVALEPTVAYPEDYNDLLDVAQEEQQSDARPEFNDLNIDIEDYDTIFIGYPNWWGDMPMIIYTFFDTYDLSGKTIAPFNTSGGSGLSRTVGTIRELEPDATVTDGFTVLGDNVNHAMSDVEEWIDSLNL